MQAPFRSTPRAQSTVPAQTLRSTVNTRTMNTQPVARMPPMQPAVMGVAASTATTAAAASSRPQPYKYTSTMRNPPQTVSAVQQQQAVQQPAVHVQGQEPLTATMLASADATEQKQMLGERLFPLIQVRLRAGGRSYSRAKCLVMSRGPIYLRKKLENMS